MESMLSILYSTTLPATDICFPIPGTTVRPFRNPHTAYDT